MPLLASFSRPHWAIVLVAAVAIALGFITNQSFWMDEAASIQKAITDSPREMFEFSAHLRGSEIQMPLFMLLLWAWEKIAGFNEYTLRLLNLPFFVVGAIALRRLPYAWLYYLLSPFALYYVGELRPYAMQLAGAALGLGVIWPLAKDTPLDASKNPISSAQAHGFLAAIFLLVSSSLTAAVWAFGLFVALLVLRPGLVRSASWWRSALVWAPFFILLVAYYAYTLYAGYRGAVARGGGLLSMIFGLYELSGVMGLGPAREALRGATPSAIVGLLLPLCPAILLVATMVFVGVAALSKQLAWRSTTALCLAVGLPLAMLAAVSVVLHFSVLGRHMTPLLPVYLLLLGLATHTLISRHSAFVVVPLIAAGLMLSSALQLRHAERFERDNYRRATELALKEIQNGTRILWLADMNAPRYYAWRQGGMRLMLTVQIMEQSRPDFFDAEIVFINRPDLRFPGVANHRAFMQQHGFALSEQFAGFEVWRPRSW